MSVASKNSSGHRRNDSGELIVFEAARYFSGSYENPCYHNSSAARGRDDGRRARMSLDMTAINLPTSIHKQYLMRDNSKIKKHKQPSSPGGRLASFLNSIFNQTNSKKKKKSKTSAANNDDDNDDDRLHQYRHTPDHRRRSSISHFTMTTPAANYDSKSSTKTPTKSSFSDRQKAVSLLKNAGGGNEQFMRFDNGSFRNPTTKWTGDDEDQIRVFRKFHDVDDGEDSDSSSDLFDLPNLDFRSTGLPVYGTTNMDRIRVGAPITRTAAV